MRLAVSPYGGRGSRAREVRLDDDLVIVTSRDVLAALALRDGDELTLQAADLAGQLMAEEPACARNRVLRLLGYRERSATELESRLAEDGYHPESIANTLADLESSGLLDDGRFAATYVRTKVAAGWGLRRISRGLTDAGISPDIAAQAVEAESPEDEIDRARRHAAKTRVVDLADAQRLASRLIRRGFDPAIARKAALSRLDECRTDSPDEMSS